jgi:hypothetical protein
MVRRDPRCLGWRRAPGRPTQAIAVQGFVRVKAHQAAVRALAFKWIRILFRCWQERTPYDESAYLNALNRRGSSLIQNLVKGA